MNYFPDNNLHYQSFIIHRQPDTGLVCLTDMWKAQCSPAKNRPLVWVRLDTTQTLLKRLVEQTGTVPVWSKSKQKGRSSQQIITEIPGILETTEEGGELRTYSTTELAVVYARFLSVECYEWALTALVEGSEEGVKLVEQIEEEVKAERKRQLSRRALIAAGWAVPIILSVGLAQKAEAHTDATLSNGGHIDSQP